MARVIYAVVLSSFALLIPVAVGYYWPTVDPPLRESRSEVVKADDAQVSTKQPSVTTDLPPVETVPRAADMIDDSIRVMNPLAFYRSSDLVGKILLPERTSTHHNNVYSGQTSFVGPQACAECHRGRVDGFLQTSHAKASQAASVDTIMGSAQVPFNRLTTRERQLHYRMDSRSDGVYQTAVVDGRDVHGERMDLILGSGKMGQSYLYWRDDELFQLPVSYFTASDSWMNSPGYPDGVADFKRPISSRCLECHTTWFDTASDEMTVNHYSPDGFVLGVTCERCHGPGSEHISYHQAYPDSEEAKHIVHPGQLSAERLIDVCRQCHGGRVAPTRPSFSFRPGEALADYFQSVDGPPGVPGVHTNDQFQRLSQSQCFQQSSEMSCVTCHNPHQFERGNDALFAIRCQQCHEVADCSLEPEIGSALGDQCTRCHMSREPLLQTPLDSESGVVFPEMIDHFIRKGVSDPNVEERLRANPGNQ